jgi:N-acetylglucosamine-6-phosphate deacetylase
MPPLLCFTNCQTCVSGELIPQDVYFSPEQGIIVPNYYYRTEGVNRIDLGGAIVAPGFLELQTNGVV